MSNDSTLQIYNYEKHMKYHKDPLTYVKMDPDASDPRIVNLSDSYYTIALTNRTNNRMEDKSFSLNEFTTDLILVPPPNCSLTLEHSDILFKKGYALYSKTLNPRDSETPIKVILHKFLDLDDIELPFQNAIKVIIRPILYTHLSKIKNPKIAENKKPHVSHANFERSSQCYNWIS